MPLLSRAVPPILAGFLPTLAPNARGRTRMARIILALNVGLSISLIALALGRGSGAHILLLAAAVNVLAGFLHLAAAGARAARSEEVLDPERGKARTEPRPFRAPEPAASALSAFRAEASGKGLALALSVDPDVERLGPLLGDAAGLEQILRNLLSDAVGSTSRGTVALRVRSGGRAGGRRELIFEVIDTGPGIVPEAQSGLFRPFRKADDGTPRPRDGTGAGLAVCKGLADLMGADLDVERRPGLGTTVRLSARFPAAETDTAASVTTAPRQDAAQDAPADPPGAPRILIVEDHALNRLVLRNMLAVEGFRADEACQGEEALEACAVRPYDLILMDYHMPVMDGIECTKRIRTRGGRRPLIIGVTADALPETRETCLAAGMDRVILKPVDLAELKGILAPWRAPDKAAASGPDPATDASAKDAAWVDAARLERVVETTRLRHPAYRQKAWRQFQADAEALRRSLKDAGEAGKAGELKETAHGLKGLCLTMGLNRLAETCKRIESVSRMDSPDWSPVLAEFEAAFGPSLAELGQLLGVDRKEDSAEADEAGRRLSPPTA